METPGLTGPAVDRDHFTVGRVEVDDTVDHDWRRLLPGVIGRWLDCRDMRAPDRSELVEVVPVDLRQP
jgi:hypothetical protein